jgi:pyridoxal phosphate enzyme (YggS family)
VKTRTAAEIEEAIGAGVKIIGENYVQEADKIIPMIESKCEWHFIGSIQENKINKMLHLFDMIETIGTFEVAKAIDSKCKVFGRNIDVLIEVNSGRESQKSGVMPENLNEIVKKISTLTNLKIMGLMTMGPAVSPEELRPYFKLTKNLFDELKKMNLPNADMKILSMGMSDSYVIAIEEGANLVRIGTKIFGPRKYN